MHRDEHFRFYIYLSKKGKRGRKIIKRKNLDNLILKGETNLYFPPIVRYSRDNNILEKRGVGLKIMIIFVP